MSNLISKINIELPKFENKHIEIDQEKIKTSLSESKSRSNNTQESEVVDLTVTIPDFLGSGSMYSSESNKYDQYGGDQGALIHNADKFLNDETCQEIIKKYYPDATVEDMELLFFRMNTSGCGYVAGITTLMQYASKMSPEEFTGKFGFPQYVDVRSYTTFGNNPLGKTTVSGAGIKGLLAGAKKNGIENEAEPNKVPIPNVAVKVENRHRDYNYEYLYLDFFLYVAKNEFGYETIEEVYGNAEEEIKVRKSDSALDDENFEKTGMKGTSLQDVSKWMSHYAETKGITLLKFTETKEEFFEEYAKDYIEENYKNSFDIKSVFYNITHPGETIVNTYDNLVDTYNELNNWPQAYLEELERLMNKGRIVVVRAEDFTIYYPEDINGNGKLDDIAQEDVGGHVMTVTGVDKENGKVIVSSWGSKYLIDVESVDKFTAYNYNPPEYKKD